MLPDSLRWTPGRKKFEKFAEGRMTRAIELLDRAIKVGKASQHKIIGLERIFGFLKDIQESQRVHDKALSRLQEDLDALTRASLVNRSGLSATARLRAAEFRISSQNYEDGVLIELFSILGTTQKTFAEICSGDNGGNSGALTEYLGWKGLMVDGNEKMISQARARFERLGNKVVQSWVTKENVNQLLTDNGFSGEMDLLSIDLDGNDYWIWQAIEVVSPRVVVVEYNPLFGESRAVTIPYQETFYRHDRDEEGFLAKFYYGASLGALKKLAAQKGYRLVHLESHGVNAFFVRADLALAFAAESEVPFRKNERHLQKAGLSEDSLMAFIEQKNLPLVQV